MSHKKVHSKGNVPFLWEDIPGVPKITGPIAKRRMPSRAPTLPPRPPNYNPKVTAREMKIPLPPRLVQPLHTSSSMKGLGKKEDPFLVALKECTKSVTSGKASVERKNRCHGFKARKIKFSAFSCKGSCGVKDGNLARLRNKKE
ncbi:hypothetical protein Acr_09g0001500 [Actinidia rufa]|uniref:Uncharacterized protein n=1 Tax=Actinidia rufa TaxID=165716 RepID=A0A7J0F4U1_9ERIC|nr:hypothetical protein Acr_09g0001500 [Actinidia rufa]